MANSKVTSDMRHSFIWISVGLLSCALLGMASNSLAGGDKWVQKKDMPTARYGIGTSSIGTNIYAVGGRNEDRAILNILEIYDTLIDSWIESASMPSWRAWLSTSELNGKIYAIGGETAGPSQVDSVEIYDPATDSWTRGLGMPTARAGLSTSVVNGKIYAIGGQTVRLPWDQVEYFSLLEIYDPATDSWTRGQDMPTQRSALSTSVLIFRLFCCLKDEIGLSFCHDDRNDYSYRTD